MEMEMGIRGLVLVVDQMQVSCSVQERQVGERERVKTG